MPYTPVSYTVYRIVYSAVLGGIQSGRNISSTTAAHYDHDTKVAAAVAQEIDTRLNLPNPTDLQVEILSSTVGEVLNGRFPVEAFTEVPAFYQPICDAILAVLTQSTAFWAANVTAEVFQPTWFIDAVNGNDNNTGVDAAHALKTDAQRQLRWGNKRKLTAATSVTWLSDLPITDPVNFDTLFGPGGSLTLNGTPTIVKSGAIDVVTARNRGAQTPYSFTSIPAFDGTEVGKLIKINAGARNGHNFWCAKNNGAGSIRTFEPGISTGFDFTPSVPVNGDTYDLIAPTVVYAGSWVFSAAFGDTVTAHTVTINGLQITGFDAGSYIQQNEIVIFAATSKFFNVVFEKGGALQIYLNGCAWDGSNQIDANVSCNGGGVLNLGSLFVNNTALLITDRDFILQNGNLNVYGGIWWSGFSAAFDASGSGKIILDYNGQIRSVAVNGGGDLLWGTNNTGYAIRVRAGSEFVYTTKPTINGGLGAGRESIIGGTDKQWGAIPYVEPTNNAAIVVYA